MAAPDSLAERARQARVLAQGLPSPCISVCTMNATSGLCEGCLRTLDEIAAWSVMGDADKHAVWQRIEQRASQGMP